MTTAKRTVKRTPRLDLGHAMHDYLQNRSMRERSEREESSLKGRLMAYLETHGDELVIAAEPFVSYAKGSPVTKTIVGARRTRRRSKVLDTDKAMALIKKKGLQESCLTTIVVVDEDALLAANFEEKISDKELAAIYEEKDTYAFNLVEG
jgi:hypothetical protein